MEKINKSPLWYAFVICLCLAVLNLIAEIGIGIYIQQTFEEINSAVLTKDYEGFIHEINEWNSLSKQNIRRQKRNDDLDMEKICDSIESNCPILRGPPGFTGDKGNRGMMGLPGGIELGEISGIAGFEGPKGDKGVKGKKGSLSRLCKVGEKGEPGMPGVPGFPGHRCYCNH